MNISEISIRKPVFAWMLMLGLIVFGVLAFERMGVSQLPDIDFPVVGVNLSLDGAAPQIMELDVIEPIEGALMGIQGIRSLSSSSRMGAASITVEFDLDKDIDSAVQEVQNKIAQATRLLPKELDPPVINKTNPEDQPILWLAVSSEHLKEPQLMSLVRDQIKDKFTTIPGVAEVSLGGYVDPSLRVWLSAKKMRKYDLSVSDILNTIRDEHSELPAGRIEMKDKELNIRTLGEAPSPEDFSNIIINRRGGSPNFTPIALHKVADIEDGLADVRRKSRTMGKSAVGLGIKKQRGSNAVEVGKAVKLRVAELSKQLPKGVDLEVRFDATVFIEESIHELNFTLLLSALLTALVCWLFLGSWSATLNVILAIPTSVIGSFIVLKALGFTLNTFTLLGLSLAIGIVVDDAIIVLENIVRHLEKSKNRMKASLAGSKEITFAAMAATAAIIAIFLPIAFMKGIIGKFFFQFGVTLSVAVALSLLEALTLTPMRCSQFLEITERTTWIGRGMEYIFHRSSEIYQKIIIILLRHRWKTIMMATLACTGSFSLVRLIKKEFVPPQDQSRLMLRVQTPVGSSLDFTDRKFREIEEYMMKRAEVKNYFGAIGGMGGGEVSSAMMFVSLKDPKERDRHPETKKLMTHLNYAEIYRKDFKAIKDVKVVVQDPSLSGFSAKRGFPVEFTIRGPDWQTLIQTADQMKKAMEQSQLMTDIDSDYREGMPEVLVVPDREKAKRRGVSIHEIGETIQAMMGGVLAGKYSKDGHRYDVRARLQASERSRADDIKLLQVRNNRGEMIPLSDLVKLEEQTSLQAISRQDRERAVSVYANMSKDSSQAQAIEHVEKLAKEILPAGYRVVLGGSAQTFAESFQSLIFALLLGILISYMILASQFNSFIHPLTVLVALPFSVSGAFIALLWAGQTLNIYSMIGLVLLMGIVKKNSILLVDFTNQMREQGMNVQEALVQACPQRLRPILMTSLATIAGAIPPALAMGPGAESRIPMAVSVIGGVALSTALTLFIVPCVYSLLSTWQRSEQPSDT